MTAYLAAFCTIAALLFATRDTPLAAVASVLFAVAAVGFLALSAGGRR